MWREFKDTVLPYLVALGVVILVIWLTDRNSKQLVEINTKQAAQIRVLADELRDIRQLLSEQGYVLPPQKGSQ